MHWFSLKDQSACTTLAGRRCSFELTVLCCCFGLDSPKVELNHYFVVIQVHDVVNSLLTLLSLAAQPRMPRPPPAHWLRWKCWSTTKCWFNKPPFCFSRCFLTSDLLVMTPNLAPFNVCVKGYILWQQHHISIFPVLFISQSNNESQISSDVQANHFVKWQWNPEVMTKCFHTTFKYIIIIHINKKNALGLSTIRKVVRKKTLQTKKAAFTSITNVSGKFSTTNMLYLEIVGFNTRTPLFTCIIPYSSGSSEWLCSELRCCLETISKIMTFLVLIMRIFSPKSYHTGRRAI